MYSKDVDYDKFYTKDKICELCVSLINLDKYDIIVEPSAGKGNFLKYLPNKTIAFDILPDSENIIKQNWLTVNEIKGNKKIAIGNPPFGKRNKLSKSFINKCIELNFDTIAFILPEVYKKYNMQQVFPSEYKLIEIKDLPKDSFTINNGEEYNVLTSFFIWTKDDSNINLREKIDGYKTDDFIFIKPSDKHNADFFILGASINTVKEIEDVTENNRGYYIKSKLKSKQELIKIFKDMPHQGYTSVSGGVSWITKRGVIKNYIEYNSIVK